MSEPSSIVGYVIWSQRGSEPFSPCVGCSLHFTSHHTCSGVQQPRLGTGWEVLQQTPCFEVPRGDAGLTRCLPRRSSSWQSWPPCGRGCRMTWAPPSAASPICSWPWRSCVPVKRVMPRGEARAVGGLGSCGAVAGEAHCVAGLEDAAPTMVMPGLLRLHICASSRVFAAATHVYEHRTSC